jgi:high-affinity iron transporter
MKEETSREEEMRTRPSAFAILAFSVLVVFFQVGSAVPQEQPAKTPELTAKGTQLYEESCAPCHGIQGDGKGRLAGILSPPPHNFTEPLRDWKNSKGDPAKIFGVIKNGVPNTAMVGFSVADENVWALVYRVMEFSEGKPGS